jgi:uncharacterized protein (TIGR03032 family)
MISKSEPSRQVLQSLHTSNFADILHQFGISLVVSTGSAGKLVVVRAEGNLLNTHFRTFYHPTGLATTPGKLAIGNVTQICELHNVPAVAQKLEPAGKHDACYLPRSAHITGEIDIHEMAYAQDQLWFVNTRFSCLCTLHPDYSFVPRWRPPFVSVYDWGDRCHLNGLGIRDHQPRYVTALGETDRADLWQSQQGMGGILMDIRQHQVLCRGLSLPNSPRWYAERLWVLESGKGNLSQVEPLSGSITPVAELPSFTRGLDFYGPLAFVGVSRLRPTAGGLPIAQRLQEEAAGIWVVHIQTGEIVAFLKFDPSIPEVFAVAVLTDIRFPEVVDWDEQLLAHSFVLPEAALQESQPTHGQDQIRLEATHDLNDPDTLLYLGNLAYRQQQLLEAARYYQRCLTLQPNWLTVRYNLGVVYVEQEQWQAAASELQQVITADPNHAEAYNHLGTIYQHQHQLTEAIAHYRQSLHLRPQFPEAHLNLGIALLQQGEWRQGFAELEWRWHTQPFTPFICPHPRWDGRELEGTLLVYTEQSTGDAIQFVRYIPLIAQHCRRLILVCLPELMSLFATVEGIAQLRPPGELGVDEFQAYIPLMSLPQVLGTTQDWVPARVPYLQAPEQSQRWGWDNLLAHCPIANPQLRVGIVWAGSPTYRYDHHRSCKLSDFLPILKLSSIAFYSLQKPITPAEEAQLQELQVLDLSPCLETFGDTAAAIAHLDLVISVDTAVAHLAGALGKPVWNLLGDTPDWRWMLDRSDSPWYPTMRLFRQSPSQGWNGVFEDVTQALRSLVQPPPPRFSL